MSPSSILSHPKGVSPVNLTHAAILGALQGFTEVLPIAAPPT